MQTALLDEINKDYVRTARMKGMELGEILYKHVLRKAIIPVITVIGMCLTSAVDEILMRFIDSLMAFQGILFAMMLVTVFGAGIMNTILALGIMSVFYFARVVGSGFCRLKMLNLLNLLL